MHKHSYCHFKNGTTRIVVTCLQCKQYHVFILNTTDYLNWQRGALIQDVLTELSPDERELLISGFCSKCFDQKFAEPS